MNWQVRSTFRPRARRDDEKYLKPFGPVVAQQPSAEQQGEEPPTERQDVIPDQEKRDEGAPVAQGPALEPNQEELTLPKTEREHGDGPDVKGKRLADLEPLKMPEAGEGKPQN